MLNLDNSVLRAESESSISSMLIKLIYPLVDHPERCSVDVTHRQDSTTFTVGLAGEDMNRFVGANARTAKSLQTIVNAIGSKTQRRFSLSFREDARPLESQASITKGMSRP